MARKPKYDSDVFISYSHKDEVWVTKTLLPRLEAAGLRVCIDFRDFKPGKAALHNMRDAAKRSHRTLLVMTPNWVASEWTLFESILAQTRDPAGLQQRTIPLLQEACKVPDEISILTYVDLTRADREDIAWRQILTALGKQPEPESPKEPERDADWFLAHPYPMPPNFTGRIAERTMLNQWLEADAPHPLLVVRALGGFGKSALAWHWLTHDVRPAFWRRVVWWSFYEGDASFDKFLASTLEYLGAGKLDAKNISGKDAVKVLVQMLSSARTLLVLDGFERALRAFGGLDAAYQGDHANSELRRANTGRNDRDCISPLAELFLYNVALQPTLRAKVLLTTRLCPSVLEAKGGGLLQGCCEVELKQMQPADAVEFFRTQGIRGTHTEIETACEPYGYHPLSLRLLAGLLVGDFQLPGDIAAAKRFDVSGDLVQRQHHVLDTAYDSLSLARQVLLGRISCFRSPVSYDALKGLAETDVASPLPAGELKSMRSSSKRNHDRPKSTARNVMDVDLRDLVARGLLQHDTKKARFDLHPIVRRYAYDRLAAPERTAAHIRLRDYFAAVPAAHNVRRLEDLGPVIELYHHTVRAGHFDAALKLFRDRLHKAIYYQFGAYQIYVDLLQALFPKGEDRPPRLKTKRDQSWAACALGNSHSLSGQPRRGAILFNVSVKLDKSERDIQNLTVDLENLAVLTQIPMGALRSAETNLRECLRLNLEIGRESDNATVYQGLGRLLAYRGAYDESEAELTTALKMFEKGLMVQMQGLTWAFRAERELLRLRLTAQSEFAVDNPRSAIHLARRALELADEDARTDYPVERDYVHVHWLLGSAYRVAGQYDDAEGHLHEALERGRRIHAVDNEANILIDLARLRASTDAPDEAKRLAEEALLITERSGYILQGADAHLELAKLALSYGDEVAALYHATEARRLAVCDGPPEYTYKTAYDEAATLLKRLT